MTCQCRLLVRARQDYQQREYNLPEGITYVKTKSQTFGSCDKRRRGSSSGSKLKLKYRQGCRDKLAKVTGHSKGDVWETRESVSAWRAPPDAHNLLADENGCGLKGCLLDKVVGYR